MEDKEFIDDIIYRLELQDALDQGDSENIQNIFGYNVNHFQLLRRSCSQEDQ